MAYACLKCPISIAAEESMKRTWTIIGVGDVAQSFRWYQSLLGLPETAPAHDYFGQILDSDGTVLLCLHEWGAHEHPSLTSPSYAKPGNGLLFFFRVDNFETALPRPRALVSRLEEEPHVNPSTGTAEVSLRDLDGVLRHHQCVQRSLTRQTSRKSNVPTYPLWVPCHREVAP